MQNTSPSSASSSASSPALNTPADLPIIAFIGGGNMASAIMGGLIKQGMLPAQIQVIEPFDEQRAKLKSSFGVDAASAPGIELSRAAVVVWAVKPQVFKDVALQTRSNTKSALHLSVAAGISSSSIAQWLGTERVIRAMPNTPALIRKGMSGLFARPGATPDDKAIAERIMDSVGEWLWLDEEAHIDAVTALSGSGPAYVFYFLETMIEAGVDMGLTRVQAHQLAVQTFVGASALAKASNEPPEILRSRVTSKGGTTFAALSQLESDGVKTQFIRAMNAARVRAAELGREFGSTRIEATPDGH